MIDINACLEPHHVRKIVGDDENKIDIYEKFIYSMKLLEQLDTVLVNRPYIFKGGTSLLLLSNRPSRFSIDIDICMDEEEYENIDELELLFKNNIDFPFIDVIRDRNRKAHGGRNIKAAHFRFFYNSKYETRENYVLLDVTFQNNSLSGKKINVDSPMVIQAGKLLTVNTIEIDDLLGDKLTAFAPNTIGVKYTSKNQFNRPKCTEIIKQLYDCAYLSTQYTNLERVSFIYKEIGGRQIEYESNKNLNIHTCLLDTIKTCELLLSGGYNDKKSYKLLTEGLRSFNDYIIGEPINVIDIKSFALSVNIIACKILKKLYPLTKSESKLDYQIRTGIKNKELNLLANKEQLDEFFNNCLITIK